MNNSSPYRQRDHLTYPEAKMYQLVEKISEQYPDETAYEFYGIKTSYRKFIDRIGRAARAFIASGVRSGDAVTKCMPNTPQARICSALRPKKTRRNLDRAIPT